MPVNRTSRSTNTPKFGLRVVSRSRDHLFDFARLPDGLRSPSARCAKLALAARARLMVFARYARCAKLAARRLPVQRRERELDQVVGLSARRGRALTQRALHPADRERV